MAKEFSHHDTILTCDEGLIVGLAGTEFYDSDEELAEEGGDLPIDILRAIVEIEPPDEERKGGPAARPGRGERSFTDFLQRTDHFELCDRIDCIDVIDALLFVPNALMHVLDAKKAGLPRLNAVSDARRCWSEWAGLLHGTPLAPIAL